MSSTPDLIAIYQLEFYKKKRKWKLSGSRKEKNISKKVEKQSSLNVTYNVDNSEEKNKPDYLNSAFIEDKNTLSLVKGCNKRLSWEKQESVDIWPSKPIDTSTDSQKPLGSWIRTRLQRLQMAANEDSGNNIGCDGTRSASWEPDVESQNFDDIQSGQVNNDYVTDNGCQEDVADGHSGHTFEEFDNAGLLDNIDCTSLEEQWCGCSVDSVGEFIRGADAAPHSSQLDLDLPPCVAISDVSFTSLSRLSSQQLISAARLHMRVLRRLLMESEQRQKLRKSHSISTFSLEDIPTRDTDIHTETFGDNIVAGSHRQMYMGGRGRGRLNTEQNRWL